MSLVGPCRPYSRVARIGSRCCRGPSPQLRSHSRWHRTAVVSLFFPPGHLESFRFLARSLTAGATKMPAILLSKAKIKALDMEGDHLCYLKVTSGTKFRMEFTVADADQFEGFGSGTASAAGFCFSSRKPKQIEEKSHSCTIFAAALPDARRTN